MQKSISQKRGFTLVELLVVIGILGILAAGLLAAIDPLEQLKKGRDQTKRNIVTEYHNALTRYFSTYGYFPWSTAGAAQTTTSLSAVATGVTATLVSTGELKTTFNTAAGATRLAQLYVTGEALVSGGNVTVCFDPESRAMSYDPTALFTDSAGATGATCPSTTSTSACWICAR